MSNRIGEVTIIGLGLMGGSLCRAIRKFLPHIRLKGVDVAEVADQAAANGVVDQSFIPGQLAEACQHSQIVFVCTPITEAIRLLSPIAEVVQKETIVTDICSIKEPLIDAAQKVFKPGNGVFIGGHPMTGGEKSGFANADPYLFTNALYVLTPLAHTPQSNLSALSDFLDALGAIPILVDADLHDRIAASISHLPMLLAVTLMRYAAHKNAENPLHFKMAAGGFRDMTRIAASRFGFWRDIYQANKTNLLQEIDTFIDVLQESRLAVANDGLEPVFDEAARARQLIPAGSKGLLTNLFDLTVDAEDKPGVLAKIATTLADANINIKDIEVLKVRENQGGTIRLTFASREERHNANELLSEARFACYWR